MTLFIILFTALITWQGLSNYSLLDKLMYQPYRIKNNGEWWKFFTSAFIHNDWMHFAMNMISLFFFGPIVEAKMGTGFYLLLYITGCIASLIPNYLKNKRFSGYQALGASGTVSGVVFAAIMLAPFDKMMIIFLPVPMSAWVFGLVYLLISLYMYKRDTDNVGHDVHIYGALWGLLFVALLDIDYVLNFIKHFIS